MAIDFDAGRWKRLQRVYQQWWAGELARPLIPVTLGGRDPGRPKPAAPLLSQATCADRSIPADQLIDRIDYELSQQVYLGDAFPICAMDCFGPGILGAFLGAVLDNRTGLVWFHPPVERPIHDLHFRFDPDNVWFRRLVEIGQAGMRRWQGQVLITMTDLGGTLDILSTFRPAEKLLLDLYDHPAEVKRLLWEAHEAWHRYYAALHAALQPLNPGYSDWSRIYSAEPCYMLQCDFCYMISPAMFAAIVQPELAASCRRLRRSFYHLDGKGQLPHLDAILGIRELDGVQWVPGTGQPDCGNWPEVYRKIAAAGRKIQLLGGFAVLERVVDQLGTGRGIQVAHATGENETAVRRQLARYGVEG